MDTRIVHVNPSAGIVQKMHQDDDGTITLQTTVDQTAIAEQNKGIHNMWTSLDRWGDGKVVLRDVDMNILREWKEKGWFNKENFWRCLSDPRVAHNKVFGK